jgi:hypothetical protein
MDRHSLVPVPPVGGDELIAWHVVPGSSMLAEKPIPVLTPNSRISRWT